MTTRLGYIYGKINDFKLCKMCGRINFYEKESCIDCSSILFKPDGKDILNYIEEEYKFYKEDGYNETFIDHIEIGV